MSFIMLNTPDDYLKTKTDLENQIRSYNENVGREKWSVIESNPPCFPCALSITFNFHYQVQLNFFSIKDSLPT